MTCCHAPRSPSIRRATALRERLRGLLGRSAMPPDEILLIAPCAAIHTFGMRFAIDVAFIGHDGRVLRIDRGVGPWRVCGCLAARAVLEMSAGQADRLGLAVGMRWLDGEAT